jgi:hypothetical protein
MDSEKKDFVGQSESMPENLESAEELAIEVGASKTTTEAKIKAELDAVSKDSGVLSEKADELKNKKLREGLEGENSNLKEEADLAANECKDAVNSVDVIDSGGDNMAQGEEEREKILKSTATEAGEAVAQEVVEADAGEISPDGKSGNTEEPNSDDPDKNNEQKTEATEKFNEQEIRDRVEKLSKELKEKNIIKDEDEKGWKEYANKTAAEKMKEIEETQKEFMGAVGADKNTTAKDLTEKQDEKIEKITDEGRKEELADMEGKYAIILEKSSFMELSQKTPKDIEKINEYFKELATFLRDYAYFCKCDYLKAGIDYDSLPDDKKEGSEFMDMEHPLRLIGIRKLERVATILGKGIKLPGEVGEGITPEEFSELQRETNWFKDNWKEIAILLGVIATVLGGSYALSKMLIPSAEWAGRKLGEKELAALAAKGLAGGLFIGKIAAMGGLWGLWVYLIDEKKRDDFFKKIAGVSKMPF